MYPNEVNKLDTYEINSETIALVPVRYGARIFTQVYEISGTFIVPRKPIEIIKHSCTYFGSTYNGRVLGAQKLLNATHKIPIVVDSATSLYFFPTASASREDCHWISLELIMRHYPTDLNFTKIVFRNNRTVDFPCSYTIIKNQMLRTAYLKSKLVQNIEEVINRSSYRNRMYMVAEGDAQYQIQKSDVKPI
jgi:competence protein ComK